jgi:hypothetical protein
MSISDFFVKDVETSDEGSTEQLKTHYYRCDYLQAKNMIIEYCKKAYYNVAHIDDNFGEIFIQEPKFHLIFIISKASVVNTSINIKVSVYNVIPANKPFKLIDKAYEFLDKSLPFIKKGI